MFGEIWGWGGSSVNEVLTVQTLDPFPHCKAQHGGKHLCL